MQRTMRVSVAAALAGVLAFAVIGPAQARHYRHYSHHYGNRAALHAFGLIAGTIASIAAAEEARRDCRSYGYCYYGYGYAPPPYYYHPRYRYYYPY
jgi:hypothetical protein